MRSARDIGLLVLLALILVMGFIASGLAFRFASDLVKAEERLRALEQVRAPKVSENIPKEDAYASLDADAKAAYLRAAQTRTLLASARGSDGAYWFGVRRGEDKDNFTYELWRVDDKRAEVAQDFSVSICDDVDWGVTASGTIKIKYLTSPCEAVATIQTYELLQTGDQRFEMKYDAPGHSFLYKTFGSPEMEVTLLFEGKRCAADTLNAEANPEARIPKTILKGLTVTDTFHDTSTTFPLPVPREMDCEEFYGGRIDDPSFNGSPEYDRGVISFILPDGQHAKLDVGRDQVSFE